MYFSLKKKHIVLNEKKAQLRMDLNTKVDCS